MTTLTDNFSSKIDKIINKRLKLLYLTNFKEKNLSMRMLAAILIRLISFEIFLSEKNYGKYSTLEWIPKYELHFHCFCVNDKIK